MCKMCAEHGEGERWFLRARNYADDLLSDLARRKYVERFAAAQRRQIGRAEPLDLYARLPGTLKPPIRRLIEARLARDHYGQVVTPAEARAIVGMVTSVFRLPCMCRRITLGGEHRFCLGFSMSPGSLGAAGLVDSSYWEGPDGTRLERLTKAEALSLLAQFEESGLVHSVWTFRTPYIGGLCNCDRTGCRAMIGTVDHGIGIVHPGESIASVAAGLCLSCGSCAAVCPFGAVRVGGPAAVVDPRQCFGCGLCTRVCPAQAISLAEREPRAAAE